MEKRFPRLKAYTEYLESTIKSGIMRNAYGYPVLALSSKHDEERNTALNTMMQSSGAVYGRLLFSFVMDELKKLDERICVILSNHDELQCRVPRWIEAPQIEASLENAYYKFDEVKYKGIPLITGITFELGDTWDDTH